ncbi:uracil-xanthine permease family protein [Candidatus Desulfovibrio trichonymphae]|uniref:Putative nucleobase: H+ symporter n=1 Tax=Candidatus Desulfovibrio trichonymphae TaxID=1725232 RepID=A0A1J1DYP5_9BACT|nr:solute carrier family 23 protein [Candidatus Desulfovibrio trichonymphae]BAV92246.1 putative nucleobase : H+ symporter [Candidatus Desulfovibrio trichonymphae]GHU92539.1 xanthine/uracil permease [Deltaproteobacteria bacterium]GHU99952.1 xanthine/uracil permease [Deltaproteobacteria bacterium]
MENKPSPPQPVSELIYPLDANPPFGVTVLAAVQHILAMIIGVMTPPLIVANAFGAPADAVAYLVSISLFFAGASIIVQVSRPFGIGSGMLNVQATSFAFPATLISIGMAFMQTQGMTWDETLCTLFGVCFVGSFWLTLGAYAIVYLRKIITHTVAGVTVLMIGVSLVKVGAVDLGGGFASMKAGTYGNLSNLLLGGIVILSVVFVNRLKNPIFRMCSLVLGMGMGFLAAIIMGKVDWSILTSPRSYFMVPVPFKFGFFGFDWEAFGICSFIFLVLIIEAIGDITATASVSEQPTRGSVYRSRLKGGILCGGVFSALAAVFGGFPQITFAQNNGVIQLSGVASRKVGRFCGVLFMLFAIFPVVVVIFELLPRPVLGGALVVLFGTIATSGIRILAENGVNRRESIVIATAIGVGLVSMLTPDIFANMPQFFKIFFYSPVVSGGVTAMIVHQILPKPPIVAEEDEEDEAEAHPIQEMYIKELREEER